MIRQHSAKQTVFYQGFGAIFELYSFRIKSYYFKSNLGKMPTLTIKLRYLKNATLTFQI